MATPPNRLSQVDQALFILRWMLVGCVLILALLMPVFAGENGAIFRTRLVIAAFIGTIFALVGIHLQRNQPESQSPSILSAGLDTLNALLLFWATGGMLPVLLGAGMFPVVVGALRVGRLHSAIAAITLAVGAPLIYWFAISSGGLQLGRGGSALAAGDMAGILLTSAILLLMSVLISVPVARASLGWTNQQARARVHADEADRLRTTREHAHAVYAMAATLNADLNEETVLKAALDVGVLGLRERGPNARPVSAVLLRDAQADVLRVASARRMPRSDMQRQVPGQTGVLAQAIQGRTPVFASTVHDDPELGDFVAFQEARSVLCVPLHSSAESYGVLVFGSTIPNAFSEEHVELLTAIGNQTTIALQNAILYQTLVEEKERILEVEEDARKQLSRTLHDGPTQSVAAIAMRVNYIRRLFERQPDLVPPELQKVEELARQTSREIRQMLFTLRPLVLETQGLIPALGELAKKLGETYGQAVLLNLEDDVDRLITPDDQILIFNIVDEAVNNARKHAEAEHIWVRLNRQDEYLILEIQDDGVGFDMGEVDANYDQRGSLGMINLRERAELLAGTLEIESAEGLGTKVTLTTKIDPDLRDAAADEDDEDDEGADVLAALRREALRMSGSGNHDNAPEAGQSAIP